MISINLVLEEEDAMMVCRNLRNTAVLRGEILKTLEGIGPNITPITEAMNQEFRVADALVDLLHEAILKDMK
jgi:hypothetical protein